MSDTQGNSVGCFSWFRGKGKGRAPEREPPPPAPSPQNETRSKSITLSATKAVLRVAAAGLKLAPIPYLDEIPTTLLQWIQIYESIGGNEEKLKELLDTIQKAQESIFHPLQWASGVILDEFSGVTPDKITAITNGLRLDVNRQLKKIKSLQQRSLVSKVLTSNIDEEINELRTRIQGAITNFNTSATTLNLIQAVRSSIDNRLSKLKKAQAEYTAVKSKSECLPSTRETIQSSILDHLLRSESRFVWLRASPGMGKTAISMSIASDLANEGVLAASFFWDKNQGSGLNSLDFFPSTLARQLAEFSAGYESALVRHLRRPGLINVEGFPLERQMKALILDPMDELKYLWDHRVVIVLDGLDECGDFEALEKLMRLVLMLDKLPRKFAVLVSCRPESQVVHAWEVWETASREVPKEDIDSLLKAEHFHTEYDAFARACRELPVLAAIRVRDVCRLAKHGSTLKREFLSLCDITSAPRDLDAEYLRILRRAFTPGSLEIPEYVFGNYREVVGIVIAAQMEVNVDTISHLLQKAPDDIRGTLEPISSIVDLPSDDAQQVKFYHATVKEFITGKPKGAEQDKVFFINDPKGYFLGLILLKFINNAPKQLGMPTKFPLGNRNKWDEFMREKRWGLPHIRYATEYLPYHLDPSELSVSGELQSEFDRFVKGELRSFLILYPNVRMEFPHEIAQIASTKLDIDILGLRKEVTAAISSQDASFGFAPWQFYRSFLPFSRSSSIIHKLYAHLSDPITIFSISGEFTGKLIPLSKDANHARKAMQDRIQKTARQLDYEAESRNDDIRGGIVTCSALSHDGKFVALGFGNGAIEIIDIDNSSTISQFRCKPPKRHPVWIEFIHSDHQIAVEDNEGNITIFGSGSPVIKLDQLRAGPYPPVTVVSRDQTMIARAPRTTGDSWYNDMTIIYVSEASSVQHLARPTPIPSSPQLKQGEVALPSRRSIGFSPGGRYIGAFDLDHAFIWSTESRTFIAQYHVRDFTTWMLNPCDNSAPSPRSLIPTSGRPDLSHDEGSREPDEEWLEHPFLDLTPSIGRGESRDYSKYSSVAGKVPILARPNGTPDKRATLWFNGQPELTIPSEYRPLVVSGSSEDKAWYGDRVLHDAFFHPRSSNDGTRILLQGKAKAPIVVDISQVV